MSPMWETGIMRMAVSDESNESMKIYGQEENNYVESETVCRTQKMQSAQRKIRCSIM